jgi:hypothetical protein
MGSGYEASASDFAARAQVNQNRVDTDFVDRTQTSIRYA